MLHQWKKGKAELFFPTACLRHIMQGHSFWLAVRLNMGLGVRFLYPYPMIVLRDHWSSVSIGWPFTAMYSGFWTPIKEDSKKSRERLKKKKNSFSSERLKAGSADGRLGVLATLFATTATLPRVLNLTVTRNISLRKTDSGLAVIASQLITELKAIAVVVAVHDSFFTIV